MSPNCEEFETVDGTLLIGKIGGVSDSAKVAAFDMDWTLIKSKSGRTFQCDEHDWQWWHERVPSKLRRLVTDGFRVVIFTN